LLLFYLLADESESMAGTAGVDAINAVLPALHAEVRENPIVADLTRFALVAFSTRPQTLLPLSDLHDVTGMPGLSAGGCTNYGAAFDHLRATISSDVATLLADGFGVYRPAVFFCSDGQPTDAGTWEAALARLQDSSWAPRPNIVSFGFGQADPAVIAKVGTLRAYMAADGVSPARALTEWAGVLLRSMLTSAYKAATGQPALVLPAATPGLDEVPLQRLA
jgi:uncharacterized protein YegL